MVRTQIVVARGIQERVVDRADEHPTVLSTVVMMTVVMSTCGRLHEEAFPVTHSRAVAHALFVGLAADERVMVRAEAEGARTGARGDGECFPFSGVGPVDDSVAVGLAAQEQPVASVA